MSVSNINGRTNYNTVINRQTSVNTIKSIKPLTRHCAGDLLNEGVH